MRNLYPCLIAFVALIAFASVAVADALPVWDTQIYSANSRFKLLSDFDNEAVLDKETGLVWELSPDTNTRNHLYATFYCIDKNVGGRKGWRLPSVHELASLIDPYENFPALPSGHPFVDVQDTFYWAATSAAYNHSSAWLVQFGLGGVGTNFKTLRIYSWCVRGGSAGPERY